MSWPSRGVPRTTVACQQSPTGPERHAGGRLEGLRVPLPLSTESRSRFGNRRRSTCARRIAQQGPQKAAKPPRGRLRTILRDLASRRPELSITEKYSRYQGVLVSETLARFSAFSGVVVLLLAATLLALLARPALLDGVAALARPKPGLAGISIGVLRDVRLLRHFNLRWSWSYRRGATRNRHAARADRASLGPHAGSKRLAATCAQRARGARRRHTYGKGLEDVAHWPPPEAPERVAATLLSRQA